MERSRVRSIGLALVFVMGAGGVLYALHHHYPVTQWLIWRYLGYLILCAGWAAACLGAGLRLFDALHLDQIDRGQRHVLGFALGVLAFGLVMSALGFAKLWSSWTFFLVPAVLIGFGRAQLAEAFATLRATPGRSVSEGWLGSLLATAIGTVGIVLVYVPILHPDTLGYDSRWYHLVISEQYAIRGGIEAFTEGWVNGAQPQFASMLYGWAFLLPTTIFDQIELSRHLEFTLFLATLASVPSLAKLLTGEPQPFAWVFVLLFPGLYLYDSSLIAAADHVAAFWAVPLALATFVAWRDFSVRPLVLVSLMASGPLLTKYTALSLLVGPGLLLLARAVQLLVKGNHILGARARTSIVAALCAGLGTGLLATSPHWLKNLVYYGDPLFPFLHRVFPAHPLVANVADRLESFSPTSWQAERSLRGVLKTLAAPFSFAFVPHDWSAFHGTVPVFGFLYTVTMPAILFVKKRARLVALYAAISMGLMFWYWTYHQDRYLQALLPWMAACVAAILSQSWRLGRAARTAVVVLIVAQLVVGAGVPFLPTHAMIGRSPFAISIELMGAWRSDRRVDLTSQFPPFARLSGRLPDDAKLLVHDQHLTLGLRYPFVTDATAWQTGIDYSRHPRPSEMWSLLRSHGVTHVAWDQRAGHFFSSIGDDIAFLYFANNHLESVRAQGNLAFGALPDDEPLDSSFEGKVAILGCGDTYDSGVYPIDALTATWFRGAPSKATLPAPTMPLDKKQSSDELQALLADVDALWVESKCFTVPRGTERKGFHLAMQRKGVKVYVRKRPRRSEGDRD